MNKISSQEFSSFLNRATIGGKINKYILQFQDDGIKFAESDEPKFMFSVSKLDRTAFKEFENIGNIVIGNGELFNRMLSRFVGDINLEKVDNKIKMIGLFDNKECFFTLSDEESLDRVNEIKLDKLQHELEIDLSSEKLKEAVKNSESIDKDLDLLFETKKGELIISSGKDDAFKEIYNDKKIEKELKVNFGQPLKNVIGVLRENITIKLKNDYPIMIKNKTKNSEFIYVVGQKEETQ